MGGWCPGVPGFRLFSESGRQAFSSGPSGVGAVAPDGSVSRNPPEVNPPTFAERTHAVVNVMLVQPDFSPEGPWLQVGDLFANDFPEGSLEFLRIDRLTGEGGRKGPDYSNEFRITLDSALVSAKSRETVSRYLDYSSKPEFEQFRFLALKLLNRLDLTGTFRFIDREAILWGYVLETIDVISRSDPSILVFGVTPHEFGEFVVWSVAEWMGVKAIFFQPCPLAPAMLARRNLDEVVISQAATVRSSAHSELITKIARSRIERLDEGLAPTYMEHQKARDVVVGKARHRLLALRSSLRWLWRERFPEAVDFSGHEHRHRFVLRLAKIFLVRSLQSNLRKQVLSLGLAVRADETYCVLALHYEPERTSIPDGLPIVFQGDALVFARNFIPEHVSLLVKEHYSQQSSALRGFLGRSPHFHDVVRTLPNTRFVPTASDLSTIVTGADCVFTLTGTVAIEAVLRGVPVVYFGHPWWAGLPGTVRAEAGADFNEVRNMKMPSRLQVVSHLLALIRDTMIPGIPDGSAQVGESAAVPPNFQDSVSLAIYRCLRGELAR